jgi:HAD superfamily hydrolase (TIGR01509 family)
VFDLDGVLVESEQIWDEARRAVASEAGVEWPGGATEAMMGMSSKEWSQYLRDEVGVPADPAAINDEVLARVLEVYRRAVPWIAGAREAVERMAARWPLGIATSANREIVDLVVEQARWHDLIPVTVSSEEVENGKPAPDVYLEAARRMGVDPQRSAAVEDSTNGLKSAAAAGMRVIAIPNDAHPPKQDGLDAAAIVLDSIDDLRPELLED